MTYLRYLFFDLQKKTSSTSEYPYKVFSNTNFFMKSLGALSNILEYFHFDHNLLINSNSVISDEEDTHPRGVGNNLKQSETIKQY